MRASSRQEDAQIPVSLKVSLAGRVSISTDGVLIEEERLPGRQGRLVFAYLVSEHGRPVFRDELAEALWGGTPPARWEKALGVIASKLRALLGECGVDGAKVLTSAFGCYRLELPEGSWVDLLAAARGADEAEAALAGGQAEKAKAEASQAVVVARLPLLPGEDGAWVERRRRELADVLDRALDCLADACLRSGNASEAAKWAQEAIALQPFRESGYRRLMHAHAAAGNRAEALQAYERCRRLLAEELGAYPSPETESIYRELLSTTPNEARAAALPEDDLVSAAVATADATPPRVPMDWRRRKAFLLLVTFGVLLAAGAAAAVLVAAATNGSSQRTAGAAPAAARPLRVALVLPGGVSDVDDFPINPKINEGLQDAAREYRFEPRVFDSGFDLETFGATLEKVARERLDLVIAFGIGIEKVVARVARRFPNTHFVVLDTPVEGTPLEGVDNVTGIVFSEHEAAYLAGYLAGLLEQESGPRLNDEKTISLVGGLPIPPVERYMAGFAAGAKRALPEVKILEGFSMTWDAQDRCAALANEHIAVGADIVFPVAGACGFGALDASLVHNVWGIGVDGDLSYLGPHILVSVVKRYDRATFLTIKWFKEGRLPRGETIRFGLTTNGVGIAGISPAVSESIRNKVADVAAEIRAGSLVVPSRNPR
jgi:basic membrane lipoprotein Med (substrate-binding protein (PBP1-ABC) superfamily)/DNA-binding SARP family transcriptional activator